MTQATVTIGKFSITTHKLPVHSHANCISIHLIEGDGAGEGGTFDIEKFEKAVEQFYNENF